MSLAGDDHPFLVYALAGFYEAFKAILADVRDRHHGGYGRGRIDLRSSGEACFMATFYQWP